MRSRVLIAVSDATAYNPHKAALREAGWLLHQTPAGADPASLVRSHVPDVFLLELGLLGADSYRCVHAIKQDALTKGVLIALICPPTADKALLEQCVAAGVSAILVSPVAPEALLAKLAALAKGRLEADGTADAHAPGDVDRLSTDGKAGAGAVRRRARPVAGNSSLLERDVLCPFHEEGLPFSRYTLRTGRIITETSFFDVPIYASAARGADFINYHLLNVVVCPLCLFASNNPGYFAHPADPRHQPYAFTQGARHAIEDRTAQRRKIAEDPSQDFFSEKRTLEEALVSYELAIHCSQALYGAGNHEFPLELMRMGNYHLRMAHLLELTGRPPEQPHTHYVSALELLKQAFAAVEDANLYKTVYQLVATGIYLGEDKVAVRYLDHLRTIDRDGSLPPQQRSLLHRYLHRCQLAWEDRTLHRGPVQPEPVAAEAP